MTSVCPKHEPDNIEVIYGSLHICSEILSSYHITYLKITKILIIYTLNIHLNTFSSGECGSDVFCLVHWRVSTSYFPHQAVSIRDDQSLIRSPVYTKVEKNNYIIYISSLLRRANSTDFLDSLFLSVTPSGSIGYRFWQVLKTESSVRIKQIYVSFC